MAQLRKVASIQQEGSGWRIIWQDGKEDFVADKSLIDLAQQAERADLPCTLYYESKGWDKETQRKIWILKKIELPQTKLAPAPLESPQTIKSPQEPKPDKITIIDWDAREKDIHRQVALKAAVEIETALIATGKVFDAKGIYPDSRIQHTLLRAEKYYQWLNKKED